MTVAACDAANGFGYRNGSVTIDYSGLPRAGADTKMLAGLTAEECCLACFQGSACLSFGRSDDGLCSLASYGDACPYDVDAGRRVQAILYEDHAKTAVGIGPCDLQVHEFQR